jgi:OOP family OmpA-OmpF porin
MLRKTSLFLYLILFTIVLRAQNLLPNPGFEDINICCENSKPCCPKGWFKANFSKYTTTNFPRPGIDESLSVEIIAAAIGGNNHRTYMQAPILCPLVAGQTYILSMYVRPSEFILDELGAYFSDTLVVTYSDSRLIVPYQAKFLNEKSFIGKKNKWQKIQTTYVATGSEKFVVIGNFRVDSMLHWKRMNRESAVCIYQLDSVSLMNQRDSTECDISEAESIFYRETRRHNYKRSCNGSINLFEYLLETKPDTFFTDKPIILKNVFFDFDRSELLPASYKELNVLVEYLMAHPEYRIAITGHTDSKGSDSYNERLSSERALAVGNYLIMHGVKQIRISTGGKGSTVPIADNNTDSGREQNRRVEFLIFE